MVNEVSRRTDYRRKINKRREILTLLASVLPATEESMSPTRGILAMAERILGNVYDHDAAKAGDADDLDEN